MEKTYKSGQISVFVEGNIKEAKEKLGIGWRGLIVRGIKSLLDNTLEREQERERELARLKEKVREQGIKIYKLENPESII